MLQELHSYDYLVSYAEAVKFKQCSAMLSTLPLRETALGPGSASSCEYSDFSMV